MQMITTLKDGSVSFNLDVTVPAAQAEAFRAALTGHDDDIVLAAEKAMRRRLGDADVDIEVGEVELYIPEEDMVTERLRTIGQEAHRL